MVQAMRLSNEERRFSIVAFIRQAFSERDEDRAGAGQSLDAHRGFALRPTEARRLVERFEWHYSPKPGSWLDMAESELAVLATQCLDRRIPGNAAPASSRKRYPLGFQRLGPLGRTLYLLSTPRAFVLDGRQI